MSDKTAIPLLGELLLHLGAVPTIFVSLGFFFVAVGAFGTLAVSNTKLLFGFVLIFLGLTCLYGGRDKVWRCHGPAFCSSHEYDGYRHLHIDWRDLSSFLLSVGSLVAFMWLMLHGQWPLCSC